MGPFYLAQGADGLLPSLGVAGRCANRSFENDFLRVCGFCLFVVVEIWGGIHSSNIRFTVLVADTSGSYKNQWDLFNLFINDASFSFSLASSLSNFALLPLVPATP